MPFGIYLCLDCSSNHRNLGVHISFVRSTNLDRKYLQQITHIELALMAITQNGNGTSSGL